MSDNDFPNGLFANKPHKNAPDFVKAGISIQVERFIQWLKAQKANEKGYVKLQVLEARDGEKFYAKLDDWEPSGAGQSTETTTTSDDIPF